MVLSFHQSAVHGFNNALDSGRMMLRKAAGRVLHEFLAELEINPAVVRSVLMPPDPEDVAVPNDVDRGMPSEDWPKEVGR